MVEEAGRTAVVVASDLSTEAGCKTAVAAAADQFGRIDVLVNNAAFQVSVAQCGISQAACRALGGCCCAPGIAMADCALQAWDDCCMVHGIVLWPPVSQPGFVNLSSTSFQARAAYEAAPGTTCLVSACTWSCCHISIYTTAPSSYAGCGDQRLAGS